MAEAHQTTSLITTIVGAVILFVAAPVLYTVLTNATGAAAFEAIPLVGPMATIIGLLFGAFVLYAGIKGLMKKR